MATFDSATQGRSLGSTSYPVAPSATSAQGWPRPAVVGLTLLLAAIPAAAAKNRPPTVWNLDLAGSEDADVKGQVVATDPDGNPLTHRLKGKAKHGEVTVDAASGAFVYVPAKDFHGDDAFAIDVSDGKLKATAQVTVKVAAVNDVPVIKGASLKGFEDAPVKGAVSATDRDGDAITFRLATKPAHGDATVDARTGAVIFRGAPNFFGDDAFTVEASDGVDPVTAEVKVQVVPVNDMPVAAAAVFRATEDEKLEAVIAASDVDGDALKYTLVGKPKHGEATVDPATGALSFAPAKDFFGDDELTVDVSDGKLKTTAKIALRVAAVNDAPVIDPFSMSTSEDVTASGKLSAADVDSENLTWKVSVPPAHGDVNLDAWTGAVSYRPAPNSNGPDAFTVEVSDGAAVVAAEVKVAVAAVNDAPIARSAAVAVDEDGKLEGTMAAADVDGDPLTWRLGKKPKHGTVEANGAAFTYVPGADFHGADSFTFEVSDGKLKSAPAVVSIDVRAVNDAPVAQPLALSTDEDVAVSGVVTASDVDGDVLTFRVSAKPEHGEATVDARTGAVTYRPAQDSNGPDAFVVEVSDGTLAAPSAVSVAVKPVYDAPIAKAATLETAEDTVAEGKLPGSDPDGEPLTFRLLTAPKLGSVVLVDSKTGAWRFSPGQDLNGDDEIAFDVSDGTTTVKGTVKIKVAAVNDAPTLAGVTLATDEDHAVEGTLKGQDIDGDALTYTVSAQPKNGTCSIVDGTKVKFVPAKDFFGSAACAVQVSDGRLTSMAAPIEVAVAAVNDAPIATAQTAKTDEDLPLIGKVAGTDVDGDALTFQITRPPAHGTVELKGAQYVYTPAADYNGADAFSFSAADPTGASSETAVKIAIAAVDDAPEAISEQISVPFRGTMTGRLKGFDRENKPLTFKIVAQPQFGRVKLVDEKTGDFVVTTDGAREDQTFSFVVFDGALTSEPADMVLKIQNLTAAR